MLTQQLFETAERRINELINGPGSSGGYRTVWHTLELEGIYVPRLFVQLYLKEIDPEGCDHRKRHKLKRREYQNPGPNSAWHMDGYDKIKPWGFPIHGAIDGYSRKVLWLKVTRSNNNPDNIAKFYLESVETIKGCPKILVTDLGTENGTAASIQCYFQEDSNAHRYVPSPRNQRIECWWSQFHRVRASWWRLFFQDLADQNKYDGTLEIHKEALWYCFSDLLQKDLDFVKNHWNSHHIRRSRYDTVSRRPDVLFNLPHRSGGEESKILVNAEKLSYVKENVLTDDDDAENVYTSYFDYVCYECQLNLPSNYQEGIILFEKLIDYAENGS